MLSTNSAEHLRLNQLLKQAERQYQELLKADVELEVIKPFRIKIRKLEDELLRLNNVHSQLEKQQ